MCAFVLYTTPTYVFSFYALNIEVLYMCCGIDVYNLDVLKSTRQIKTLVLGDVGIGKTTLINNLFGIHPDRGLVTGQNSNFPARGTTEPHVYRFKGPDGEDLGLLLCDTPGTRLAFRFVKKMRGVSLCLLVINLRLYPARGLIACLLFRIPTYLLKEVV